MPFKLAKCTSVSRETVKRTKPSKSIGLQKAIPSTRCALAIQEVSPVAHLYLSCKKDDCSSFYLFSPSYVCSVRCLLSCNTLELSFQFNRPVQGQSKGPRRSQVELDALEFELWLNPADPELATVAAITSDRCFFQIEMSELLHPRHSGVKRANTLVGPSM